AVIIVFSNCMSPVEQENETTNNFSSRDSVVLYKCLNKTLIIFHPDSATTKSLLDADKEMTFVESLNDFEYYSKWLEDTLKHTDIKFINSTARYITIDNGTSLTRFTFANDNQWFGCIVS